MPKRPTAPAGNPPEVLRLAANPLRWRLLGELSRSDHQVGELSARVDERQSLVSYHLGLLRQGGLVTSRRSSADRRDSYYRADLAKYGEMLIAAGGALHPGIELASAPEQSVTTAGRVLFLCTGNSARSQMAEALLELRTHGTVKASSAGSHPTRLHRNAVKVMRTYGVDLSGRKAKHFGEFITERLDYVVTLCDRVREVCPQFPGPARPVHWSIPNPSEPARSDRASYPAFEATARELDERIRYFLPRLATKERTHD